MKREVLGLGLGLTRFRGHPEAFAGGVFDAQDASPGALLSFGAGWSIWLRAARSPDELAREFEPTAQSICAWVATRRHADR
jgi:hypothetical protein